jgi:two-component system NtrC family sensor kinase
MENSPLTKLDNGFYSRINHVPNIGTLVLDSANGVGSINLNRANGQSWTVKGTSMESRRLFLEAVASPQREDATEFLERAERGETLTFSPVSLATPSGMFTIGLATCSQVPGVVSCLVLDLGERYGSVERSDRLQRVSATVLGVLRWIAVSDSRSEAWVHILNEFTSFTGSKFGFIGKRLLDEDGNPYLQTRALTNIAWNKETKALYQRVGHFGFEFRNLSALFGPTLTDGVTIVSQDYRKETRGVGIPEGHPPLESYLGLPIKLRDETIGMVAVAGSKTGFDPELVSMCESILSALVDHPPFLDMLLENGESEGHSHANRSDVLQELERMEIAAISISDDTIRRVTAAAGRVFDCLSSQLVNIKLQDPNNLLGLAEIDLSQADLSLPSVISEAMISGGLQRWLSMHSTKHPRYFRLTPLTVSGIEEEEVYMISDYTTQAEAFQQMQTFAKKAAEVSQMQTRLVNMISHELRTPLSSLQTSVELIEMSLKDEQVQSFLRYLNNIYQQVDLMTEHIDSVLTFGKVSIGEAEVVVSSVHLSELWTSIIEDLVEAQRVRTRLHMSENAEELIAASDAAMLRLAFKNVLSNALKFSTEMVDVIIGKAGEQGLFQIEVIDQGVGISPEDQKRIFEPFYRGKNAHRYPGTGVGLSLTKGIIRVLDGEIAVSSEENKGTKITITIKELGT